jgi:hypothetical protein
MGINFVDLLFFFFFVFCFLFSSEINQRHEDINLVDKKSNNLKEAFLNTAQAISKV